MDLTPANLQALFKAYKTNFQQGFASLGDNGSLFEQVCTVVPSSTAVEVYPFLKGLPRLREWIGDRVVHSLESGDFSIKNRKFELTEGVSRDAIEDDTYGLYAPVYQEFGRSSREHPNELMVETLTSNPKCYDGRALFGNHTVFNDKGKEIQVSNDMGGTGAAWYLMDLTRVIKPVVFQKRRDYAFKALTDLNSERVYMTDQFLFGVDARANAGPGLWQLAVRCNEPFNAETYEAARARLQELKGDHGRPLALRHSHTMVPNGMEGAALRVLNNSQTSNGATNEWAGTSKLILNPWLPSAA
ncbi:Mu-like prophage major head subunit gpT family protein [Pseudomonas segetis]|uniref:Mu-like prophage major head subunit gpT n=1 Tax=Pseudomonas segetis TaxID=298908 RepID=A0A239JQI7_9PSED|nr:Mu-like prophage major head subunit gpT family protein [Pseudomonas segetis]SNT07623.1 Mu-like prophage major head subunit gpT [Pseudomonas segetis]